jgi:hypothetical protein
MAHVAQLDESNLVIQVIVVSNDYEPNVVEFATDLLGGKWVQTSYNNNFRKNFAGIGYTYDEDRDAFIPPKLDCHEEVTLNEELCLWECANDEHQAAII